MSSKPGTFGSLWPADESSQGKLIAQLQADVRELKAARTLENATIATGGLSILKAGALQVVNTASTVVLHLGLLKEDDGSTSYGMTLLRDDGTVSLQSDGDFLGIRDKTGRIVVSDDGKSGHGLATPHFDMGGLHDTNTAMWPSTNATTYTGIAGRYMEVINPRLTWQIYLYADAGVTASFQMTVNGSPISTVQTVVGAASGTISVWSTDADLPSGVSVGDVVPVMLNAKVSGSGNAKAMCQRFSGQQSA